MRHELVMLKKGLTLVVSSSRYPKVGVYVIASTEYSISYRLSKIACRVTFKIPRPFIPGQVSGLLDFANIVVY